ncbi:hypothetical protein [Furfurilactobacillus entadae]|uniref:hypothetical protein n=1 Tax=Furfurilactobacillus entadae TaxID=2922307 RepID=UPI0035EE21CC
MNDDQQPGSEPNLTREQYRKRGSEQATAQPEPSTSAAAEPSRRATQKRRGWQWPTWLRRRSQKNETTEPVTPTMDPNQPESRVKPDGKLTGEEKSQRLARRLNVVIITLVALIAVVYVILRFIG